uniref:Uncharacterized protein n=1 Tax=Knipowitschia caucasica TaxID=637954 RepID=A0AAV2M6F4_KNICA
MFLTLSFFSFTGTASGDEQEIKMDLRIGRKWTISSTLVVTAALGQLLKLQTLGGEVALPCEPVASSDQRAEDCCGL